jgi:hypothetical protein
VVLRVGAGLRELDGFVALERREVLDGIMRGQHEERRPGYISLNTQGEIGMEGAANLAELYKELKVGGGLPGEIWDEWLWKTDPEEQCTSELLLNRNHLLGLLICLSRGLEEQQGGAAVANAGRLSLMEKSVQSMTLRELKDTIANLQIEWPLFVERLDQNPNAQQNLEAVVELIDQCSARFGSLCANEWGEAVMDDLDSVEPGSADGRLRVTHLFIRRTVCTFLVLYRHLHLLAVAKAVPAGWNDPGISKYHMEASNDDFHLLCMRLALPVAATLNYKHDFPGMYNHVSQVVFFHNSEYQRIARCPLEELGAAEAVHVLPALMQLYPGIVLKHEEDCLDLSSSAAEGTTWVWLVVAGRIYLVSPAKEVHYSRDVTALLGVYLGSVNGVLGSV